MDSKYLDLAAQTIIAAAKLNDAQIKQVQGLENQIKLIRASESNAHRLINEDVKTGKLDPNLAIVEKAKVTANVNVEVTQCEQAIKTIFPSWTSNALEAAKQAVNVASVKSVEGSSKMGDILGTHVLKTPVAAFRGFFGKLKEGVNQAI